MGAVAAFGSALAGAFAAPLVQAAGTYAGVKLGQSLRGNREPRESLIQELARTALAQPLTFDTSQAAGDPEELLQGTSLLRPADAPTTSFAPEFGLELPIAELDEIREISQRQSKFVSQISEAASLGRITNLKRNTLLGSLG